MTYALHKQAASVIDFAGKAFSIIEKADLSLNDAILHYGHATRLFLQSLAYSLGILYILIFNLASFKLNTSYL